MNIARIWLLTSHPRYSNALKWIMVSVAIAIALMIAFSTPLDMHPDEYTHFQGFQYFQGRFFPPAIGSNEVWYDRYGMSRVYNKELVYILYGNFAKLLQILLNIQPTFIIYRLFNIVLLLITLLVIFSVKLKAFPCDQIGFVFLCVPQITYSYAYINSDAWAFSLSIFLFILTIWFWEQPLAKWNVWGITGLGILTGLLLVSKPNFYISLILPYSLIGLKLIRGWFQRTLKIKFIQMLFIWVCTILLIAMPLQIIYPISQGDYQAAIVRVREEKAITGLKPSHPTGDLQLQAQGYSYNDLIFKRSWLMQTAQSFWGFYGYFRVANPNWVYQVVGYCAIGLLALTGFTFTTNRSLLNNSFLTVCLLFSPWVILLNLVLSLHNSLTIDYQPQGRYLFPSFLAIVVLLTGTINLDRPDVKRVRNLLLAILYGLALYSLLFFCLPELLTIE